MTLKIIDASVAIKWFLKDEKGVQKALEILDQIKENPQHFAVPELFFTEMLHVFCKILPSSQIINNYLVALQELGLERLGNGRETLKTAAHLAKKYHLSGYDAIYAANAQLVKGTWITADIKAHQKIAKLKISQLL